MKRNTRRIKNILLILILLLPILGASSQNQAIRHSVWLVTENRTDSSVNVALQTLTKTINPDRFDIKSIYIEDFYKETRPTEIVIIVGHGRPEGFETAEGIIPWPDLYDTIASHQPQTAIVLACHAPSDLFLHIYGFDQLVDAEAGGLIVGWYLEQMTETSSTDDFPFDRVARAQTTMKYPLGRYLWFVHGYFGNNSEFLDMYDFLDGHNFFRDHYERAYFYSYTDFLGAETVEEKNYVHNHYTIDDFAYNLYLILDAVHDQNTRIDIVAHSMGGLIVRQMLISWPIPT